MTKDEMWLRLEGGMRFTITAPGDWQFCIKNVDGGYKLVLTRLK